MNRLERYFKITRNHLLRIKNLYHKVRDTEEIVKARDNTHKHLVESERHKDEKGIIKFRSQLEVFKWILKENDNS